MSKLSNVYCLSSGKKFSAYTRSFIAVINQHRVNSAACSGVEGRGTTKAGGTLVIHWIKLQA